MPSEPTTGKSALRHGGARRIEPHPESFRHQNERNHRQPGQRADHDRKYRNIWFSDCRKLARGLRARFSSESRSSLMPGQSLPHHRYQPWRESAGICILLFSVIHIACRGSRVGDSSKIFSASSARPHARIPPTAIPATKWPPSRRGISANQMGQAQTIKTRLSKPQLAHQKCLQRNIYL